MRASVSVGVGQGFQTRDVALDDAQGREVLVEVRASGLCHSDLHLVENDYGFPMPAVFGHEIAGVVAAVGPDVTQVAVGDHVVGSLIQACGDCRNCHAGLSFDCLHPERTLRTEGKSRISMDGTDMAQAFGLSGFAPQALVDERQLAVVNREIPFPQASLLGCGVITGAGAAINASAVRVGDTVAVIGTGGVGLNAISGAQIAGALRIIAVDVQVAKLEVAQRFGATDVVNSAEADAVSAIRELTGGAGVDHAFEVIGLTQTQQQAIDATKVGGTANLVGMGKPGSTIALDASVGLLEGRKRVQGVKMGSTNIKHDIPMYADLYVQGRMNLDDLVSQEIGIDDVQEAYEQLKRGEVIRSVVTRF
ncbi:MAG: zinc-binding dehydrogenase [Propioniciclava sp.]